MSAKLQIRGSKVMDHGKVIGYVQNGVAYDNSGKKLGSLKSKTPPHEAEKTNILSQKALLMIAGPIAVCFIVALAIILAYNAGKKASDKPIDIVNSTETALAQEVKAAKVVAEVIDKPIKPESEKQAEAVVNKPTSLVVEPTTEKTENTKVPNIVQVEVNVLGPQKSEPAEPKLSPKEIEAKIEDKRREAKRLEDLRKNLAQAESIKAQYPIRIEEAKAILEKHENDLAKVEKNGDYGQKQNQRMRVKIAKHNLSVLIQTLAKAESDSERIAEELKKAESVSGQEDK